MDYTRIYESTKGGWVDLHPLHGVDELLHNAKASRILADHGYRIQLLPSLPASETAERQKWLPVVFGAKKPGCANVQIAIINLCEREYSLQDVKKGIVGALQPDRNKSIRFVWIITHQRNLFIMDREYVFQDTIYELLEML